jgi:hypothetical protein
MLCSHVSSFDGHTVVRGRTGHTMSRLFDWFVTGEAHPSDQLRRLHAAWQDAHVVFTDAVVGLVSAFLALHPEMAVTNSLGVVAYACTFKMRMHIILCMGLDRAYPSSRRANAFGPMAGFIKEIASHVLSVACNQELTLPDTPALHLCAERVEQLAQRPVNESILAFVLGGNRLHRRQRQLPHLPSELVNLIVADFIKTE